MSQPTNDLTFTQWIFVTFWKPIFALFAFAHALLAVWLVGVMWANPVQYAYGVAVLAAVPIAYVEVELIGRWLGCDEGPIFDWRQRATWLFAIGYALAIGLAAFLTVHESDSRKRSEQMARQNIVEDDRLRHQLDDPNVRRGIEALNARRARSEESSGDE